MLERERDTQPLRAVVDHTLATDIRIYQVAAIHYFEISAVLSPVYTMQL